MYSVQWALWIVPCTLYSEHCTLHRRVYSVQLTVDLVECSLYSVQSTL